jgi:hypothetical protein
MNKRQLTKEEIDAAVKLYDAAMLEFTRDGGVTTVRCDACGELLRIETLSPSAWRLSCPCSKYNDTLKGL